MRSLFVAILSIFFVLFSLVSCNEHINNLPNRIDFDTLSIDTVCPLFKNYVKPSCHVSLKLAWPKDETPKAQVVPFCRFVSSLFKEDEITSYDSFSSLTNDYIHNYFIDYLNQGKEAIDNYGDDMDAAATWMSYEENFLGEIIYNAHGIVCYQLSKFSYTGGAHGQTDVEIGVYDIENQTPLNLHSIFSDANLSKIKDLIIHQLMSDYDCASIEELTDKGMFFSPEEIEATENFMVNDSNISWVYDPYEIAPYSVGEVRVSLNWDSLKDYILPESPINKIFTE